MSGQDILTFGALELQGGRERASEGGREWGRDGRNEGGRERGREGARKGGRE